jgi:protein gp37
MSKIEWTDRTWNPVRGCQRVSPGCKHCYAELQANRQKGGAYAGLVELSAHGPRWTGKTLEVVDKLDTPIQWRDPCRVFVNSMSDLFYFSGGLSPAFVAAIVGVMSLAGHHTFQILTKRSKEMLAWLLPLASVEPEAALELCLRSLLHYAPTFPTLHGARGRAAGRLATNAVVRAGLDPQVAYWPPFNSWWGVSVEDREHLRRIDDLRRVEGPVVRWVSFEPLLEDLGTINLERVDWVVVGGESGHDARPIQAKWVRSIRDQCLEQHIPFFFKQWGQWIPEDQANGLELAEMHRRPRALGAINVGKSLAGRLLDDQIWDQMPHDRRTP